MKNLLLLSLVFLFSGCATMKSLDKVVATKYFVLEEAHIRKEERGILNVLWVEGLIQGKYIEYAKDKDGVYYLGVEPSVVVLANEQAKDYLETRELAPGPFLQGMLIGGLWIPNKGSRKEPKLFFVMKQANYGVATGIVSAAVKHLDEGSVTFIPYGSETAFVNSISIKDI
jgi:hypothetical protein